MKIEFEEWGEWSAAVESVALYGKVDGRPFGVAFSGKALSELFDVPEEPFVVEKAFRLNQAFMNEIARDAIEAGRLRANGKVMLHKEDLLPYFERRAATARA